MTTTFPTTVDDANALHELNRLHGNSTHREQLFENLIDGLVAAQTAVSASSGSSSLGDGTAALPSVAFASDPNTGVYRVGADNVGVSTGGTLRLGVSTTAVTSTLPVLAPAGAEAAPSIAFSGDSNTGLYSSADGVVGITANGATSFLIGTTALIAQGSVQIRGNAGTSAASPAFCLSGDTSTGMYGVGPSNLGFSVNGTLRFDISISKATFTVPVLVPPSTAANPGLQVGDANTGFYDSATDTIGITTSGILRATIDTTALTLVDGFNIAFNTTTGTRIGTATSQKIGFYNATPIVQGASVADATGGATVDAEARTAINALISRIEALGLIATV